LQTETVNPTVEMVVKLTRITELLVMPRNPFQLVTSKLIGVYDAKVILCCIVIRPDGVLIGTGVIVDVSCEYEL